MTLTPADLARAYPRIPLAVSHVEAVVGWGAGRAPWCVAEAVESGASPAAVAKRVRDCCRTAGPCAVRTGPSYWTNCVARTSCATSPGKWGRIEMGDATLHDLGHAYPSVIAAMAYVNNVIDWPRPGEPSAWDVLIEENYSPPEVAAYCRDHAMRNWLAGRGDAEALDFLRGVVDQTYHPEFLTFIAGKMGAL